MDLEIEIKAYSKGGLIEALRDIIRDIESGLTSDSITLKREAPYIGTWELTEE